MSANEQAEDERTKRVKNAVQCRICGAPADLLPVGIYECQANPNHVGDRYVGIFSDLTMPEKRADD